jgi:ATP-dependent Clp protease adaptor protein ClpS
MLSSAIPEVLEAVETDIITDKGLVLMLYNDDHNTFDFVIDALVEVADIEPEQAEQITLIVHFKGKCDVKRGSLENLKPICGELQRRGLTARLV